jgi:protein-S-isoprenylcysteine O-methyltransferase Ste14
VSPPTDAPAWRWGNIPIPEAHLVGLGTGVLLQVLAPWPLPLPAWIGHGCGWPLWPLLLLPAVLVVTQVAVLREERSLERRFGAAYRSYKTSVRRYL